MITRSSAWNEPWPMHDAMSFIAEFAAQVGISSPTASFISDLIHEGKLREASEFAIPKDCDQEYFYGSLVQGLLKKNPWLPLGYDPEGAALRSFIDAEVQCEVTNRRLENELPRNGVGPVLFLATRKIAHVLGDRVPDLGELQCRFGPGASTTVKRVEACLEQKLSARLACSTDMLPTLGEFLAETPWLAEHHGRKDPSVLMHMPDEDTSYSIVEVEVHSGRHTFVPKNAKTHRSIVVEPCLNGLWQLGVGTYLKGRLRRFAFLDLTDQERQRELARRGSLDGSLATLDLSSASDTISIGVVFNLLPFQWAEFLGRMRTGDVEIRGKNLPLEKFSSMGNGYTFELETLIFWGLTVGVCEYLNLSTENVGVYGDDIICPTGAVSLLIETLSYCGFTVNAEKSFWTGNFRESCGADWIAGTDVRPWFLKKELSDEVLFIFHNWLIRRGETSLAAFVQKWINPTNLLFGPDGYGDGHLLGDFDLYLPREERRRGWGGGYFDTYSSTGKRSIKKRPGDWLVPGYTTYQRGTALEPIPYAPGVLPGTDGYARTSIYTFRDTILYPG